MFGTPTWTLGGIERLAFVAIPETVRRVIIYGDRGTAVDRLREKARDHLSASGREVVSRVPDHHDDWIDAWRAHLRVSRCDSVSFRWGLRSSAKTPSNAR